MGFTVHKMLLHLYNNRYATTSLGTHHLHNVAGIKVDRNRFFCFYKMHIKKKSQENSIKTASPVTQHISQHITHHIALLLMAFKSAIHYIQLYYV